MSQEKREKQTAFRFSEQTMKQIEEIIEIGQYASMTQAVEQAIAYYCDYLRNGDIIIYKGKGEVLLGGKFLERMEAYKKRMGIEDDDEAFTHLFDRALDDLKKKKGEGSL